MSNHSEQVHHREAPEPRQRPAEVRRRPVAVWWCRGVERPEGVLTGFAGTQMAPDLGPAELALDLGAESVGWAALQITVSQPCEIELLYGDSAQELLDYSAGEEPRWCDRFQRDTGAWVLRSPERRAFRGLLVRVTQGKLDLEQAWAVHRDHAPELQGAFSCSDATLDAAYTLAQHTLQLCCQDVLEETALVPGVQTPDTQRLGQWALVYRNSGVPIPAGDQPQIVGGSTAGSLALTWALADLWERFTAREALDGLRAHWGAMLALGATTCWDRLPASAEDRPLHHALAGVGPAYLLPRYVLGVTPLEPGLRRLSIRPQLGDLRWAEGRVPTPHGVIALHWEQAPGLRGLVCLPEGIEAELWLPGAGSLQVLGPGEHRVG